MPTRNRLAIIACALLAISATTHAAPAPPDYGLDWVTIGDPGNAPFSGDTLNDINGRGGVSHRYRMTRTEITTSQWLQFVNTFTTQSTELQFFAVPAPWGATEDRSYSGPGKRYVLRGDLTQPGDIPVGGMSWRTAAMYANWLHNGRSSDFASTQSGAYDASTFGRKPDGTFTDQPTRSPGARFWIPSFDEWIKAAHYDPDKNGAGQGGWWLYPNTSDTPPIPGPPGEGEANTGFELPQIGHEFIPAGMYPDVTSPWGLLDAAGSRSEWTEAVFSPSDRGQDGTWAGLTPAAAYIDEISVRGSLPPDLAARSAGLRLASAIPAPGAALVLAAGSPFLVRPRRRLTDTVRPQGDF